MYSGSFFPSIFGTTLRIRAELVECSSSRKMKHIYSHTGAGAYKIVILFPEWENSEFECHIILVGFPPFHILLLVVVVGCAKCRRIVLKSYFEEGNSPALDDAGCASSNNKWHLIKNYDSAVSSLSQHGYHKKGWREREEERENEHSVT